VQCEAATGVRRRRGHPPLRRHHHLPCEAAEVVRRDLQGYTREWLLHDCAPFPATGVRNAPQSRRCQVNRTRRALRGGVTSEQRGAQEASAAENRCLRLKVWLCWKWYDCCSPSAVCSTTRKSNHRTARGFGGGGLCLCIPFPVAQQAHPGPPEFHRCVLGPLLRDPGDANPRSCQAPNSRVPSSSLLCATSHGQLGLLGSDAGSSASHATPDCVHCLPCTRDTVASPSPIQYVPTILRPVHRSACYSCKFSVHQQPPNRTATWRFLSTTWLRTSTTHQLATDTAIADQEQPKRLLPIAQPFIYRPAPGIETLALGCGSTEAAVYAKDWVDLLQRSNLTFSPPLLRTSESRTTTSTQAARVAYSALAVYRCRL
jgi:hypothetical protein